MNTNQTMQTTISDILKNKPTVVYVGEVRADKTEALITALNTQGVMVVTKKNLEQLKDKITMEDPVEFRMPRLN